MTLDIGTVIGDFVVEEQAYGREGAWFVSCPQGHKIFATTQMLEGGMIPRCVECANAFAVIQELFDIRNKRILMEQEQEKFPATLEGRVSRGALSSASRPAGFGGNQWTNNR